MLARLDALEKRVDYIAYIYSSIGNVFLVVMQICMKIVTETVSPFWALYIRGFLLLAINSLVLRLNNIQVSQPDKQIHSRLILRSVFSTISLSCFLSAVSFLPLGIANALFNTGPLIIFILQSIYYGKGLHLPHFVFTFVCFVGVLLIIKPPFLFGIDAQPWPILLLSLPLIGALFHALALLILHLLKGKTINLVVLQYFYIAQTFGTSFLQNLQEPKLHKSIDFRFFVGVIGLVGCAYVNQNLTSRATLLKKASYIMPFGYIGIVLSFLCDIILFQASFDWISVFGIILTSAGLLIKLLIP